MDMTADNSLQDDTSAVTASSELPSTPPAADKEKPAQSAADKALVTSIMTSIKADLKHHEKAFKRMRRDQFVATHGREENWSESKYKANVAGRHVRQKTAALYAKNPKAVAHRRETMDFSVWDENEQTLVIALQTIQLAEQMAQQAAMLAPAMPGAAAGAPAPGMEAGTTAGSPAIGPVAPTVTPQEVNRRTGFAVPLQPQLPPGFAEAQALLADFKQGMERRQTMKKFGRTLEILFADALRTQKPIDFKTSMKQLVRRTCTNGVGYVELGFQTETGPRPAMTEKLTDFRTRLDHLKNLAQQQADGDLTSDDAEIAELEASIAALQNEPEIVLRQGLIFDFPQSTMVIPDKLTKSLTGFIGARHITLKYLYTKDEITEMFNYDVGAKYTPYLADGKATNGSNSGVDENGQGELFSSDQKGKTELLCLYKRYDKPSGLVYYLIDGHDCFVREPAQPDIFVTDFWPVYALTFNAVENEDELFPPSDVTLLLDMQREYNRSRDGKREHRRAARPRYVYANGMFDDEDIEQLKKVEAFEAIGLNMDGATEIAKVLQVVPVPGVDPNLYDVNEIQHDIELVVGSQAALNGGISNATATETSISAGASSVSDSSSVDDLDAFLSMIARASSQVLMREMQPDQVTQIVGPGAVWIPQSSSQISEELYLEVEAGSTGKPNQVLEVNNWKEMLPFLLQMGSIPPTWLARETLRRLDDRMDLTEAVVDGIPSIVAQNAMAQPNTGNPATDPAAQGGKGAQNGPPAPSGPVGTGPAMGDNHGAPGAVTNHPMHSA